MRVSEKQRFSLSQGRIGQIRQRQLGVSEKLASGTRINRPSDDPVGARKVIALQSEHRRVQQYSKNIDAASHLLHTADSVLSESSNLLYRAKEIAIQGIHGGINDNDRQYLGDELASIREQLHALANTQTNDRYIFGGFLKDTPPYDAANLFVGDSNQTQYEVGEGLRIGVTSSGGAAFGDGTAATVDVFDNLIQLEAEIRAGFDPVLGDAGMQTELERLETSVEQVISVRHQMGINMNRLEGAEAIVMIMNEKLPAAISQLQDVDFPAAVSELQLVENALQGTMATTSRLLKGTSLMDFL
jgi:flagellar hook-associated protein 3 FlgL